MADEPLHGGSEPKDAESKEDGGTKDDEEGGERRAFVLHKGDGDGKDVPGTHVIDDGNGDGKAAKFGVEELEVGEDVGVDEKGGDGEPGTKEEQECDVLHARTCHEWLEVEGGDGGDDE